MYLKNLSIHGFKSFAQKTAVDFSPGVTAIVGPNGCGKSNVVDSIRWVLGEQRARLLRSESMAGVIFNGAAGKKALGMAEVELTIENTRGVLPTEYGEVTVARRLYRSGDSEYLLNGVTCRLKDVLDLFMDTGMGAGAYSVIELKMIEDILSENEADRRRLFEEAAGVTKYKVRRGQALKKLEATQGDLTRLDDIIEEVDKQVRSLSRQAQKSSRHRRFAERLRALELAMIAHDYARLGDERSTASRAAQEARDQARAFGAQVASGEAALEEERTGLVAREQELGDARRALDAHIETVRALDAEVRVGAERREAGVRALARLDAEDESDRQRLATLDAQTDDLDTRIGDTQSALDEASGVRDAALATRAEADQTAQRARAALVAARQELGRASGEAQAARRALDRLADRRTMREAERQRLSAEQESLASGADDAPPEADLAEFEQAEAASTMAMGEARDARDAAQEALDSAEAALQTARSAREGARAEVSLLGALMEEGSGDDAVSFLREHPDWDAPSVADVIGCADEDQLAVQAALGALADALVVQTEAKADAAIGRLREADRGRATFLVLSRLGRAPQERSPTPPGATPLAERVRTDGAYAPLASALFANTFLVGSLADARALRDDYPVARFVTREGAWTDGSGAVRGGSAAPGASRLGTRERLASAQEALNSAEIALAQSQTAASGAREARDAARAALRTAESERDAARQRLAGAQREADRHTAHREARDAQKSRLAARLTALDQEASGEPDEADLQTALDAATADRSRRQRRVGIGRS